MSQAGSFGGGSGPNPPSPTSTLTLIDDFVSSDSSENSVGSLSWNVSGVASSGGEVNHPGLITMPTNPGQSGFMILSGSVAISNAGCLVLGGGELSINFISKLESLSSDTDAFTLTIGLMDYDSTTNFSNATDGVMFKYTHNINSGNWQVVGTSSSVSTTSNTSVPADTDWHNFGIVINSTGASASFTIDGNLVGTISSNIPVVNVAPAILFQRSTGSPEGFSVDLFYSTLTLSNPRF